MSVIFNQYDEWFVNGEFEKADNTLLTIVVCEMSDHELLSILTATGWAKNKLKNRSEFYKKVKQHFESKYGHQDVGSTLYGLE